MGCGGADNRAWVSLDIGSMEVKMTFTQNDDKIGDFYPLKLLMIYYQLLKTCQGECLSWAQGQDSWSTFTDGLKLGIEILF